MSLKYFACMPARFYPFLLPKLSSFPEIAPFILNVGFARRKRWKPSMHFRPRFLCFVRSRKCFEKASGHLEAPAKEKKSLFDCAILFRRHRHCFYLYRVRRFYHTGATELVTFHGAIFLYYRQEEAFKNGHDERIFHSQKINPSNLKEIAFLFTNF